MTDRRTLVWTSSIALLVVVVNLPALRAPLFWDDHVYRFFVLESSLLETVSRGLFGLYFRPLGTALWWLSARLFGSHQEGYHVLSLVLHLANIALVAILITRLNKSESRGAAAASATLFAVSPVATVTVAWAANIFSLVGTAFGLAALVVAAGRRPCRFTVPAFLFLALACKEDSLVFLLPVAGLLWFAGAPSKGRRSSLINVGIVGMVPVLFIVWRLLVVDSSAGLVDVRSLLRPPIMLGMLGALAISAAVLWWARLPGLRFGLLFLLPSAALGGGLFIALPAIPHGLRLRLLYQVSAAAAVVLGIILQWLMSRRGSWRRVTTAVVIVAAVAAIVGSRRHLQHWRQVTEASERLVNGTVSALSELGPVEGPVWVLGVGEEIALDPAVKLLLPESKRSVVLIRPQGLNFLAVNPDLFPAVQQEITLWAIPGNPAVAENWIGAAAFARVHRFRAATKGQSKVPVVHVPVK